MSSPRWLLSGTPMPVQMEALQASQDKGGFAYFMEMGLGKSAVVLNEFVGLFMQGKAELLIVVCPHTLRQNWVDEAEKWGIAPQMNIGVWPTLPEKGKTPILFILNFEAFSVGGARGNDVCVKAVGRYKTYICVDESINIKNPSGVKTKRLIALARLCAYRRILSGAPVTQGPHDLWAQLQFIGAIPNRQNFYSFRNTFCKMGGFKGKQIIGPKNEEYLNLILSKVSFRAKKGAGMPPKSYAYRDVELDPAQIRAYKEMATEFVTRVKGEDVTAKMVITQMLKLQQITTGFIFDEMGVCHRLVEKSPKIEAVRDILHETDTKVLVFCHFKPTMAWAYEALAEFNPVVLGGIEGMKFDVDEEKKKFNTVDDHRVAVCQTDSIKYGHTLLGTKTRPCYTSVYLENSYSLDARVQTEDRNHRKGQEYPVLYIDLRATKMDIKAISALRSKKQVADLIVDGIRSGELDV